METAKDMYDRIVGQYRRKLAPMNYEETMKFAQEIAEKCFDAGRSHEHAAHFGSVPNVYPDKSTYMKSLFHDTK